MAENNKTKKRFDVIVVGSGFGGSVTAARLAEKGMNVLIVERGPWWGPHNRYRDRNIRREYPRGIPGIRKFLRNIRSAQNGQRKEKLIHADGLLEIHKFDRLLALTSSAVGGGSHVYTNIMEQPDPDHFDAYPDEISAADMKPYFDRVRQMLRPAPIPQKPEKNIIFEEAVESAGLPKVEYPDLAVVWGEHPDRPKQIKNAAGITQSTSTYQNDFLVGAEDGSKTTMDVTYIPIALKNGAELRPLCEVTAIGPVENGYQIRYTDHRTGTEQTVQAPRLVLSAGCLNTLRLMFAARNRDRVLPDISAQLGHHFSPNGDMALLLLKTEMLGDSSVGTSFNAFTRVRSNGRYRFLAGEVGLPAHALPLPWPLRTWIKKSTYLFSMGRDASTGRMDYDGSGLTTTVSSGMDPAIFADMRDTLVKIAAYYRPKRIRDRDDLFSVHPMGGCSIGKTSKSGVTDHRGQVFDYPGLYIADGSLYPRAPGIAPSMTIAALAERQADLMH